MSDSILVAPEAAGSLVGRVRKTAFWGGSALILASALPLFAHYRVNPISFHQFLIHEVELKYRVLAWGSLKDWIRSAYGSGWSILKGEPRAEPPALEDPEGVFAYVFSWLPPRAVVYPTEGFYYFSTTLENERVMGNVRVAELEQGKLTMAFFTVPDKKRVWRFEIGPEDQLRTERVSELEFDVTYRDKTVRFVLPKTANEGPTRFALLPEEEFVGQIHDESGLRLFLLFNSTTKSFYEVLDEERGVADKLESFGDHLLVGRRTGFVFYEDEESDRKLLVGVPLKHVERNDYFDGPGDQVPFNIYLRDKLYVAYPSTLLGAGIDDYGVYLDETQWMRIAISPYLRYASVAELQERVTNCLFEGSKGSFWTALTKEWWNTPEWKRGIFSKLGQEGKLDPATGEVLPSILAAALRDQA